MDTFISAEIIVAKILIIRGKRIMLDKDLAQLYGVTTFNFNKAVKRNKERFPEDFMFQLTKEEFDNLKFHFGISSWGGTRKLPYAFTEQGVAMLSSILRSRRAIRVNIQIMRTFIKLKELLLTHKDFALKLEKKYAEHDEKIQAIFQAIKQLLEPPPAEPKRKIGFHG